MAFSPGRAAGVEASDAWCPALSGVLIVTDNGHAPAARRGRRECRVLVVDDDPDIRELVSSLLSRAGYVVSGAGNGAAALELIGPDGCLPDLVLLDRFMPVMDGDDLAARLRERDPNVRIIAFTSSDGSIG